MAAGASKPLRHFNIAMLPSKADCLEQRQWQESQLLHEADAKG